MNHGLIWTMQHHHYGYYTPAIPWLIAFPSRLIGSHIEEWLWGFPLFAMSAMGFLLLELASDVVKNAKAFLISWAILFLLFLLSRDLMHMFGAFFYGEAIASALVGIFVAEMFVRDELTNQNIFQLLCFGLFASFCIMAKPPLSILMNLFVFFFAAIQLLPRKEYLPLRFAELLRARGIQIFLMLSSALFLKFFWQKTLFLKTEHVPEYSVKISELLKKGIHLEIPFGMCSALFNWGTFQASYSYSMVVALIVVALKGNWRLFAYQCALIGFYWGFVFGLYSTYWYNGDYGSAGRYLSHAGVAVVLLLPLIYYSRRPQRSV